jgi:uncharacterized protein YacL
MLSNIANFKNTNDLLPIFLAACIVDLFVIMTARYTTLFGKELNRWYSSLGLTAIILDIFILIVGLLITRWIFTYFNISFTPLKFIAVAVIIQLIHDLLLYQLLIKPHKGNNLVFDLYKSYSKENGAKILVADAGMVIGTCLLAMYFKNQPNYNTTALLILVIYLLPYYAYKKNINFDL